MARNFLQGKYTPKNPKKYVGDPKNIQFRSSWERKLMVFLDNSPSVLFWGSEELVIPYMSPVDKQIHRYFPDFIIKYKNKHGEIKNAVVEIKPHKETQPPKGKRMTKFLAEEYKTYAVNTAKWTAAEDWCKRKGWDFIIMDEYSLGIA